MEDSRLAYVYGWFASGKSTLLRLLDGHPELAVVPIHDQFISGYESHLSMAQNEIVEQPVSIAEFKTDVLAHTEYNRFQDFHYNCSGTVAGSVEDIFDPDDSSFDYYDFEQSWTDDMMSGQNSSIQQTLYGILRSFFENWERYDFNPEKCSYFVGLGHPREKNMASLVENFDDSKVIYVHRDSRDCIASLSTYSNTVEDYLRRGEIYDIEALYDAVASLQARHPDQVHIVEFDELIFNTVEAMNDIDEFLDIAPDSCLETPTYCGTHLAEYEDEYIGNVQEEWEQTFSEREKQLANLQMGQSVDAPVDVRLEHSLVSLRRALSRIKNTGTDILA